MGRFYISTAEHYAPTKINPIGAHTSACNRVPTVFKCVARIDVGDLWTVWKHRWDPRTTESVGEHPVVPRNGARAPWGGRIWRASECDLRRAEGRQSTLAYNKQSRTSNPPIPFLSGMKSARGIENEAGGGTDQVSLCFTTCFSHHLKISFSLHLFLLSSTFFTFSTQSWTRHVYPIP